MTKCGSPANLIVVATPLLCSELIILLFPVGDFQGGPPFACNPEGIKALVESAGFVCTHLQPVPNELSHKARAVGNRARGRMRVVIHLGSVSVTFLALSPSLSLSLDPGPRVARTVQTRHEQEVLTRILPSRVVLSTS